MMQIPSDTNSSRGEATSLPLPFLEKVEEAISHYPVSKRSASLPLLHLWQEQFGYISDEAIRWIAAKLEEVVDLVALKCTVDEAVEEDA